MRMSLKPLLEKRLPAYSGIFVLLLTLITTVWLSGNTILFVTKATVGSTPKEMKVSNISDTSFTVSYITDAAAIGSIAYGNATNLGQIALDARDQQGNKPTEYRVHFFTISNLQPATKYYFTLASGTQVVTNNGTPYEITTAPTTLDPPLQNSSVKGTAALDDGTMPTEGIVTVSTDNSQIVTSPLQPGGTYDVSVEKLRTKDLSQYITLTPDIQVHIQISTPTQQTEATVLADQRSQIPKMILSKNYDFTLGPDPLSNSPASDSAEASGSAHFPTFEDPTPVTSPQITTPKDNQAFKEQQPLFKGKALPNTQITIVINSQEEITATLESDSNGFWEFRPPVTLAPGTHTITLSSVDDAGVLQKLTRSFTVYAQGSEFTEPSVSPNEPTPTDEPPVTPTPPALPSPSITPTPSGATASPSVDPNLTFSPTRAPLSPTGTSTFINGLIGAAAAIGIGTLLFIFTAI